MGLLDFWLSGESRTYAVWTKGQILVGRDPNEWRMDSMGGMMRYSEYGQTTAFGWEIDHIDPDGSDELWNLQPLYWLNNRRKSDKPTRLSDMMKWLADMNRK